MEEGEAGQDSDQPTLLLTAWLGELDTLKKVNNCYCRGGPGGVARRRWNVGGVTRVKPISDLHSSDLVTIQSFELDFRVKTNDVLRILSIRTRGTTNHFGPLSWIW